MKKYKAVLISTDGEDYKTDYKADSIDKVWEAVDDGGSRWFFYPIVFVTLDNDTPTLKNIIADAPDSYIELNDLKGHSIQYAMNWIKNNQDFIEMTLS